MSEKFGVSRFNSIEDTLKDMPIAIQNASRRNRLLFDGNWRAMEDWAKNGFVSGYEVLGNDAVWAEAVETGKDKHD